jgi:hypothetical protein
MSLKDVQFNGNKGAITNDIYYADSMTASATFDSCSWQLSIAE